MIRSGVRFLSLAIFISVSASAAPELVSETEFQAYKELAQTKLDTARSDASKDIQILQTRLDNQDKRLDDQQSRISDTGLYLTLFGILIALVAAALGLIGYFSVRNRAREEACEVARAESQKWFDEKGDLTKKKISAFEQRLSAQRIKLEEQVKLHTAEMKTATDALKRLAEAEKREIQRNRLSPASASKSNPIVSFNPQALDEMAKILRLKPEAEYSFDDWDDLAYTALQASRLDDAIYYWQRAIEIPGTPSASIARAIYNKGVALGELGRHEDELAAYDAILTRFGGSPEPEMLEILADTLVNKGVTLDQLGRNDEEIATYREILARFGNSNEPELQELTAGASNVIGFHLLCQAKEKWQDERARTTELATAADHFAAALTKATEVELRAAVLGNQAYMAALSGKSENEVRDLLQQALRLGCEGLYQETLKDLEISPISEDSNFRLILDAVWADIKPHSEVCKA